jgi:cellobiose transport system permease protein
MAATSAPGTRDDAAPQPPPRRPDRQDDAARPAWRSRLYRWDLKASPYAYVAPFFVLFAAFGMFPLLYTVWVSLHQVNQYDINQMSWVGWQNFVDLWHDPLFWNALRNTLFIGVVSTVPQLFAALGLAHLLNYRLRGRTFFRSVLLLPFATSVAATTLVFGELFARDYGMVNWLLAHFGVSHHIDWANGPLASKVAISIIVMWRWTGYNTLIYLAAMQAIPNDLYEAAAIDGASRWQQFRKVTIPGIRPTIVFTIIISTIGATQIFGEPLLFGGANGQNLGGITHQYETLGLYIYDQGWNHFHLSRAATISVAVLVITMLLVLLNVLMARLRGRR